MNKQNDLKIARQRAKSLHVSISEAARKAGVDKSNIYQNKRTALEDLNPKEFKLYETVMAMCDEKEEILKRNRERFSIGEVDEKISV